MSRKDLVAKFEVWTPAKAQACIEKGGANRKLSEARVVQYTSAMKAGAWKKNGETIKISTNGQVMDGQHRLKAVVESNKTSEMRTVRNVTPSVILTVDDGFKRTTAHALTIIGEASTTTLAHSLMLIVRWQDGTLDSLRTRRNIQRPRRDEQLKALKKNGEIRTYLAMPMARKQKLLTRSVFCFLYYVCGISDQDKADEFFTSLETGLNLNQASPIYVLRERLIKSRMETSNSLRLDTTAKIQITIKAWNAFVKGTTIKMLRTPKTASIPEIA